MGSVDRRGRESEMPIEGAGLLVLGLNHEGSCGDDGLGLKKPFDCIFQQTRAKPRVLLRQINRKPRRRVRGMGCRARPLASRAGTKSNSADAAASV